MGKLMQKQYYLLTKPVVLKEEAVVKVRVEYIGELLLKRTVNSTSKLGMIGS